MTAVIDGSLDPQGTFDAALPTLAAAGGTAQFGRLDITFTAKGGVQAAVTPLPAATVTAGRGTLGEAAQKTYNNVLDALDADRKMSGAGAVETGVAEPATEIDDDARETQAVIDAAVRLYKQTKTNPAEAGREVE